MPEDEQVPGAPEAFNAAPANLTVPPSPGQIVTAPQTQTEGPEPDLAVGEGSMGWQIDGWTPQDPFAGQLIFTDDNGPVLAYDLNPMFVKHLAVALNTVHTSHLIAMGLPAEQAASGTPEHLGTPSDEDDVEDVIVAGKRRRRLQKIILGIVVVFIAYSLISSAIYSH